MRLACPACAAQYEIMDGAIPPEGRDVECSGCGHVWHQPGAARAAEPELPRTPDAVLAILREEAAREIGLRRAERGAGAPLAPTALPDPAALAASLHWARRDAEPPAPVPAPEPARAADQPPPALQAPLAVRPRAPGRAYRAGFGTAAAIALLAVGAYVAAPHLADRGEAGARLMALRVEADSLRAAWQSLAETQTDRAIDALRALAARF